MQEKVELPARYSQHFENPATAQICVVIPMYRVGPYIQQVISGIPEWVWRIIVVDDCSPDDCAQRALDLNDPRVVLVSHPNNQGVGGAMLTGFSKAAEMGASVAVKMDGDGQMSPGFLQAMVEPILAGRADYTKGNRFFHVREISRMPLVRRIGNLGLSFLTKIASGYWNVFDPTNGYLAIDLITFRSLDQDHIHRRYFFETSMLIELNLARAVVAEIPMPAIYAGEVSSLSVGKSLYQFGFNLARGFQRRLWLQYFVLDFSLGSLFMVIGVLLLVFGLVWGVFHWVQSIQSGVPASTGTVMIAVLPVILGFQLLLQALAYDIQNVPRTVLPRRET
jgi:dolichol-phosphate mannosyltransferase